MQAIYKHYGVEPKAKQKPLSPQEIYEIAKVPFKTMKYSEFAHKKHIDDCFNDHDDVLIIYESIPQYGHWCALHRNKDKSINFFDSYGFDDFDTHELTKTPNGKFKTENNMDFPYLLKLLYDSNRRIEYNDFQFQKHGPKINTCGRWCALFFMTNTFLSPEQLISLFEDIPLKHRDDVITILTELERRT